MTASILTHRDLEILAALDKTPLTSKQLLHFSQAFIEPFHCLRRVQARLHALEAAGRVCRWPLLAIAGRSVPACYSLTRSGFVLLYGAETPPPSKRAFQPVGIARQRHMYLLAEFLTHLHVCTRFSPYTVSRFGRENALRLEVGKESIYPDASFHLESNDNNFRFFVELDRGTERLVSERIADPWERKLRLYEAWQDLHKERFRVLIVSERGGIRLDHLLALAALTAKNSKRSLVYAIGLQEFLAASKALTTPIFRDHQGRQVSLLPPVGKSYPTAPVGVSRFPTGERDPTSPLSPASPPSWLMARIGDAIPPPSHKIRDFGSGVRRKPAPLP